MKTIPLILLLLVASIQAQSQQRIKQMLILGDSHLNGEFGEYLHKKLHDTKRYDIYSIAIGGAGSRHFTMTMRNHCCGYKIRETCYGEEIIPKQKIRTIEKYSSGNNEIVGKQFKGQLKNVLANVNPDIVVIALGNNYVNDHQTLVNIIKAQSVDIQIVWVGPLLRANIQPRMVAINQVVKKNNLSLVRSDDIIGSDTLTTGHFYGKLAQNWASKIADRLNTALYNPKK